MHFLLLLTMLAQVAAEPPAIRVALAEGKQYATNTDGVRLALKDACAIEKKGFDPSLTFWVVIPPWVDPASGFAQVAHVNNSTITRTSNRIQPRLLKDDITGAVVVATDLELLVTTPEQLKQLKSLHERLAAFDSYFNQEVVDVGGVIIPIESGYRVGQEIEVKLIGGGWGRGTFKAKDGSNFQVEYAGKPLKLQPDAIRPLKIDANPVGHKTFTAEAYLNPDGAELFSLTHSNVPVLRLEEYVAFGFSTVNGGQYYERVGVEKTLGDTVAKFAGFEAAKKVLRQAEVLRLAQEIQAKENGKRSILQIAAELDPELAKSKAVMRKSAVTGRQRSFLFVNGSAIAPTEGLQLVAVTFDIAEDATNPQQDPNRNLSVFETYNGGEAILAMPNGMLLYIVFDAQDRIIAAVPDSVAHDFQASKVRSDASTARVFAGVSCANCHENKIGNDGWQPVRNDIHESLRGLTKLLGDAKPGTKRHNNLLEVQRLASAYRADDIQLKIMLDQSRLSYQRAVGEVAGVTESSHVVRGLADTYWGYWYDEVTPQQAVLELTGKWQKKEDAVAFLIRKLEPNLDSDLAHLLREDINIDALKRGHSLAPSQWRTLYPNAAERVLFGQNDEEE